MKLELLLPLVANQSFALARSAQEPQIMQLERGKKLDGVLDFKYTRDLATTFKLAFADVPQIPLEVRPEE